MAPTPDRRAVVSVAFAPPAAIALRLAGRLVAYLAPDLARAEATARTFAEAHGFAYRAEGSA
ncbi:MAG: hypothetical protein ACFBWO_07655 [Paracoccaceae bacterium]